MCGINGFTFESKNKIDSMNEKINHRGPDYAGVYVDHEVTLGHVLLSIRDSVDVSKQPYSNDNSPWVLLFNGQIYNTNTIISKYLYDNKPNSHTDTEVIYKLIEKQGWDFIDKIHGMFSIVLYNKEENIIKLYRDASGQKNLYYYFYNNKLIFSSEIKSILSHEIPISVNEDAVSISCSIGYLPGALTLFKHINKLLPSECIEYNLKTKQLKKDSFKSIFENKYSTENILSDVVSEHLLSDYKVSLNLSGGLDSSLILYEANKLGYSLDTYTTFFDINEEHKLNEDAILARKLAKDFNTHHQEVKVTKESYYDNFIEAYSLIEEPNYNISLPIYLQTAKYEGIRGDKKRVVLSGDGGDEVFGGYSHYLANKRYDIAIKMLTPYFFNKIKNKNTNQYKFQKIPDRWFSFKNFGKTYNNNQLDMSIVIEYVNNIYDYYNNIYGVNKNSINNMMLLDRIVWLASENFIRSDKIFMSQSMELRSPLSYMPLRDFFDNNLEKSHYINKRNNKLFLREHYSNKLPEYILNKSKSGWRAPVELWYDKKYKDLFLGIISQVEKDSTLINWTQLKEKISKNNKWPGKTIHLYLSLALLSNKYKLNI